MRGQGMGSALMASAETEARDRGCLGIHVDALQLPGTGFYEKIGFSLFGTWKTAHPGIGGCSFQKRLT